MKVLVVDDSITFRTLVKNALTDIEGIEIVGSASNGSIALQMLGQKKVDLVILDMNMPVMDGMQTITAMNEQKYAAKVIVFASKTARSAKETLEVLRMGAIDFVVKPDEQSDSSESMVDAIKAKLLPLVQMLQRRSQNVGSENAPVSNIAKIPGQGKSDQFKKVSTSSIDPDIIVVASSTGGPAALEVFFSQLKGPPKLPILCVQHMPPKFTKFLAKRISDLTGVDCHEGVDGEHIEAGKIYMAPGDYHMTIKMRDRKFYIGIDQGPKVCSVRPAADPLFESAADFFRSQVLGFVLTGMGEDGCHGSVRIKENGGTIMIQDKESCVVWGMPSAVYNAGAFDAMADVKVLATRIAGIVNKRDENETVRKISS